MSNHKTMKLYTVFTTFNLNTNKTFQTEIYHYDDKNYDIFTIINEEREFFLTIKSDYFPCKEEFLIRVKDNSKIKLKHETILAKMKNYLSNMSRNNKALRNLINETLQHMAKSYPDRLVPFAVYTSTNVPRDFLIKCLNHIYDVKLSE